jgi:Arc/MetJ-type ribon-helix-helix transcriptional regulator
MSRTTVSLDDETETIIERETGDGGEYESTSEFVRECIRRYDRAEEALDERADLEAEIETLEKECDRLQERADRVDDLEQTVERLENEKSQLIQDRQEKQELARYVEDEREAEQRWREAPLWTRVKWKVTGMPSTS